MEYNIQEVFKTFLYDAKLDINQQMWYNLDTLRILRGFKLVGG